MLNRYLLLYTGLLGLSGVALGALGAHALRESLLAHGMAHAWEIAVMYQLFHTLALLAVALWTGNQARPSPRIMWAARCWIVGVVLFSGSLYGLALGGPWILGPVTPLGGVAFLIGWGCLVLEGIKPKRAGDT